MGWCEGTCGDDHQARHRARAGERPSALEAKRSESILALLADLRARAERGEILTLAVAYETNEQTFGHEIVGRGDQIVWGIIGELELAKVNVMIKMGRLKPPGG